MKAGSSSFLSSSSSFSAENRFHRLLGFERQSIGRQIIFMEDQPTERPNVTQDEALRLVVAQDFRLRNDFERGKFICPFLLSSWWFFVSFPNNSHIDYFQTRHPFWNSHSWVAFWQVCRETTNHPSTFVQFLIPSHATFWLGAFFSVCWRPEFVPSGLQTHSLSRHRRRRLGVSSLGWYVADLHNNNNHDNVAHPFGMTCRSSIKLWALEWGCCTLFGLGRRRWSTRRWNIDKLLLAVLVLVFPMGRKNGVDGGGGGGGVKKIWEKERKRFSL